MKIYNVYVAIIIIFSRGQNISYSDSVKTFFTYLTRSIYSHNIMIMLIIIVQKRDSIDFTCNVTDSTKLLPVIILSSYFFKSALQGCVCYRVYVSVV